MLSFPPIQLKLNRHELSLGIQMALIIAANLSECGRPLKSLNFKKENFLFY